MTTIIELSPESKLRAEFETATTMRQKIEVKRKARTMGYEQLAREMEAKGYMPEARD